MAKEKIRFVYDREGDVLDIVIGKPRKAVSEEIGDDIVVRRDVKTDAVVGFTIINFSSIFAKRVSKKKEKGPIEIVE